MTGGGSQVRIALCRTGRRGEAGEGREERSGGNGRGNKGAGKGEGDKEGEDGGCKKEPIKQKRGSGEKGNQRHRGETGQARARSDGRHLETEGGSGQHQPTLSAPGLCPGERAGTVAGTRSSQARQGIRLGGQERISPRIFSSGEPAALNLAREPSAALGPAFRAGSRLWAGTHPHPQLHPPPRATSSPCARGFQSRARR